MDVEARVVTRRARYERVARVSIARWLAAPVAPTVCFADTHLVPDERPWSDDAADDLFALLEELGEHEILSLGDLTEAVGLSARARAELVRAPRLLPLWDLLRRRRARVVPGNHDLGAEPLLAAELGGGQVLVGGFELDALSVRHGHERAPVATRVVELVGPVGVPLYERARRWLRRGPERLSNAGVLAALRGDAPFVLFGHTHAAGVSVADPERAWANPGCFLRSAQSFIALRGTELSLYGRA